MKEITSSQTFKCNFCNAIFAHKNNLYRHQKSRCSVKIELENIQKENTLALELQLVNAQKQIAQQAQQLDMANKEITKLRKQLDKHKDKTITELKRQNKSLCETQKISSTTLDQSMHAITYLSQFRQKAPRLQKLTHEAAKDLLTREKKLYDYLMFHNSENTLYQYIGDIVLGYIKKENPDEQSVWNDENIWKRDPMGVTFAEYVITPIIDYLKKYLDDCLHNPDYDVKNVGTDVNKIEDADNIMYRTRDITSTMETIRSPKFKNSLLEYIGSHVPLDKLKIKKDEKLQKKIKQKPKKDSSDSESEKPKKKIK